MTELPFSDGIPLPNHQGYVVRPCGEIWSIATNWRGKGARRLSEQSGRSGYLTVSIKRGERNKTVFVHRAVCEAFHGKKPSDTYQVRHLNGNKLDNRAENLCWGTAKENADDREQHGTTAKGERNGFSVLTQADVDAARHFFSRGMPLAYMAAVLGVEVCTLSDVVHNKSWKQETDWLDELEKCEKEATPGPWHQGPYYKCDIHSPHQRGDRDYIVKGNSISPCDERDAALIVALRNSLPRLLAALRSSASVSVAGAVEEQLNLAQRDRNLLLMEQAVLAEREGCLQAVIAFMDRLIVHGRSDMSDMRRKLQNDLAAAIRARGETAPKAPEEKRS